MAEEKDKFTFQKNVSKKSGGAKNGQYNRGLVPNGREYDWQVGPGPGGSWGEIYGIIRNLEASETYSRLAGELTLWAASGAAFLNEYKAAYAAMDAFIIDIWRDNKWETLNGIAPNVYVISTSGALVYRRGSTIEEVMADKFNYNNNPAVSAAVATFNGNVCIAKNGHYTEEEKNIVSAGYNIGVDVKAVKRINQTSRNRGEDDAPVPTYNITKTMEMGRAAGIGFFRGAPPVLNHFFETYAISFTTMVSEPRPPRLIFG